MNDALSIVNDEGIFPDEKGDEVFYHEELDLIRVFGQFSVLIPEKYGWVVIGQL